jgi:hypothetical protein
LSGAGQGIKQSGFAGIWVSSQGQGKLLGHGSLFLFFKVIHEAEQTIAILFEKVKEKFGTPNFLPLIQERNQTVSSAGFCPFLNIILFQTLN